GTYLFQGHYHVHLGDGVNEFQVFGVSQALVHGFGHGVHGRFDLVDQVGQVAQADMVTGAFDGPTAGLPKDHDTSAPGQVAGIFHASQDVLVHEVPRDADAENVP